MCEGHELCSGPLKALFQVMVVLVTTSTGIDKTTALKTFVSLEVQNRYQTKVETIFWFNVSNLTGYLARSYSNATYINEADLALLPSCAFLELCS